MNNRLSVDFYKKPEQICLNDLLILRHNFLAKFQHIRRLQYIDHTNVHLIARPVLAGFPSSRVSIQPEACTPPTMGAQYDYI